MCVCDAIVTPRGRKERERSAKSKNEMIIGYGRTIFPHEIKKQISQPTIFPYKNGKRSLAPVVAFIVRLLLGGEDSRTRGERARFRVRGKGRHILTILFCVCNERGRARKVTRDCVPLEYFFPFFITNSLQK